jgi:glucose-1-phosphate cytidylyltransferase
MKVVLFCGGLGLRIRDASITVPKPLVTVGDRPILWHVMKYYAHHGHREFILCLGHGGDAIRAYFRSEPARRDWTITLADTGLHSSIGERLSAIKPSLRGDAAFLCNYADGLTDLHLPDLLDAFASSGKIAALLCARPSLSYHFVRTRADGTVVALDNADAVELRVNGGYFVFRQEIFDYLRDGEDLVGEPFRRLIGEGRLLGYRHDGFWKNMDTFKDKQALDDLYAGGNAPWAVWSATGDSEQG